MEFVISVVFSEISLSADLDSLLAVNISSDISDCVFAAPEDSFIFVSDFRNLGGHLQNNTSYIFNCPSEGD